MTYTVRCIKLGQFEVRGPQVFWMDDWDEWYPLDLSTVLIRGNGLIALVNTDLPLDLESFHREFPRARVALPEGQRGRLRRTYPGGIAQALEANGIRPDDITHILLTPLELHTTSALQLFPRAEICMTKRGWVHFHTTHWHPHDQRWRSFSREVLRYLVVDAWDRVRLLEDEDQIAPGLRTWWSGVHHRASMVVEADTESGTVCISDSFWYYEHVTGQRMLGHGESIDEALTAYARVRRTARHIVPAHDPLLYQRYPGGWISPARAEAGAATEDDA